jgi:metallophosphoesterase superfamily enzyme
MLIPMPVLETVIHIHLHPAVFFRTDLVLYNNQLFCRGVPFLGH